MIRILDLLFATRPMLQLAIWSVYLVSLNLQPGSVRAEFRLIDLGLMAMISLAFSGAAYLNQVFDFESDKINAKMGFLQRGFLTRRLMVICFLLFSFVALIASIYVSTIAFWLIAQFILLGWLYSAPPGRLKDRPVGGLLTNAWAHGFCVSAATMFAVNPQMITYQSWDLPAYFFLTVAGSHVLTTMPDRRGDAAAGKMTVAVVMRRRGALVLALGFMIASGLVAFRVGIIPLVCLSTLASGLILWPLFVPSEKMLLAAIKVPLLLLTLLAGYYYHWYLLFVVALLLATRIYYHQRFDIAYPRLA